MLAVMELARVDALVNNLASLFESGLEFYTQWKKKLERQPRKDAVSTSLDMSSHRIKAAYQIGFAMIGTEFSAGDGWFPSVSPYLSPTDMLARRLPTHSLGQSPAAPRSRGQLAPGLGFPTQTFYQSARHVPLLRGHPHPQHFGTCRAIPPIRLGPPRAPGNPHPRTPAIHLSPR